MAKLRRHRQFITTLQQQLEQRSRYAQQKANEMDDLARKVTLQQALSDKLRERLSVCRRVVGSLKIQVEMMASLTPVPRS